MKLIFLLFTLVVSAFAITRTLPDYSKGFNWTECGECSHNGTYQVAAIYPIENYFPPSVGKIFVSASRRTIVIKATGEGGGDQYVTDNGYYFVSPDGSVCFTNNYTYSDMLDKYTQVREVDFTETVLPLLGTTMLHGSVRDGGACGVYLPTYIRRADATKRLLTLAYTQMLAPPPTHTVVKAQIGMTFTSSSYGVNSADVALPAVCSPGGVNLKEIPSKFTSSHIFAKYMYLTILPYCPVFVPDGLNYVLDK
jgi:hypothetical protein